VIQNGAVDIVADSMTITCARWKYVDFSADYFDTGQRVLVPIDSAARGIGDLGGQKVCAAAGTTSIQEIAAQPSHPVPVTALNWTDCLVMLQQGQVAAISTDSSLLAGLAAQDPLTKQIGPPFTVEAHGLAMSKNSPDFVRFVNAVLEKMTTAMQADQAAFSAAASNGNDLLAGLAAGMIVASLLMAAACAWGLARRLAEYR
jgi:polar amino acid transport system substrate-binding protein